MTDDQSPRSARSRDQPRHEDTPKPAERSPKNKKRMAAAEESDEPSAPKKKRQSPPRSIGREDDEERDRSPPLTALSRSCSKVSHQSKHLGQGPRQSRRKQGKAPESSSKEDGSDQQPEVDGNSLRRIASHGRRKQPSGQAPELPVQEAGPDRTGGGLKASLDRQTRSAPTNADEAPQSDHQPRHQSRRDSDVDETPEHRGRSHDPEAQAKRGPSIVGGVIRGSRSEASASNAAPSGLCSRPDIHRQANLQRPEQDREQAADAPHEEHPRRERLSARALAQSGSNRNHRPSESSGTLARIPIPPPPPPPSDTPPVDDDDQSLAILPVTCTFFWDQSITVRVNLHFDYLAQNVGRPHVSTPWELLRTWIGLELGNMGYKDPRGDIDDIRVVWPYHGGWTNPQGLSGQRRQTVLRNERHTRDYAQRATIDVLKLAVQDSPTTYLEFKIRSKHGREVMKIRHKPAEEAEHDDETSERRDSPEARGAGESAFNDPERWKLDVNLIDEGDQIKVSGKAEKWIIKPSRPGQDAHAERFRESIERRDEHAERPPSYSPQHQRGESAPDRGAETDVQIGGPGDLPDENLEDRRGPPNGRQPSPSSAKGGDKGNEVDPSDEEGPRAPWVPGGKPLFPRLNE